MEQHVLYDENTAGTEVVSLGVYGTSHMLPSLSVHQWSLVENVTKVLAPFEQITTEISSHNLTAADAIPKVAALKRLLGKVAESDRGVGTAKSTLLET